MPRRRIAMETGTHSPWVSRVLTAPGHEVIDPGQLSPVKHRSAQAQLHLTEIRAHERPW